MFRVRNDYILICMVFIIYFGITLRSLYFPAISIAPFPVVSMFFCYALIFFTKGITNQINKNILLFLGMIMLVVSLSLLITMFDSDSKLNMGSIIGLNLNILMFISIYLNKEIFKENISVLNYVLSIHFILFCLQFLFFHLLGEKIDLLQPITGEVQRVNGFSSLEANGLSMFRPSGLFNEPGNYAIHILILMWMLKVNDKINPLFEKVLILSIILSFSLSGIVGVIAYIVITFDYSKVSLKNIALSSCIFMTLFYFFYDLLVLYINERLGNISGDNSANVRLSAFDAILDFSDFNQIFGVGFANDKVDIHLPTIPYLLVTFGFVGSVFVCLLFFYIFIRSNVNLKTYLFFAAVSFQFYTIMHPLFWLFLVTIIISFENKRSVEDVK